MTSWSFPHNLVLESQPHFGFTPEIFNLNNFLINKRIFMIPDLRVHAGGGGGAKCSAF